MKNLFVVASCNDLRFAPHLNIVNVLRFAPCFCLPLQDYLPPWIPLPSVQLLSVAVHWGCWRAVKLSHITVHCITSRAGSLSNTLAHIYLNPFLECSWHFHYPEHRQPRPTLVWPVLIIYTWGPHTTTEDDFRYSVKLTCAWKLIHFDEWLN